MAATIPAVPDADGHLDASASLLAALSTSPHAFLQPTTSLHTAAILAVKRLLDPLAVEIADVQAQRRDESGKKRKRPNHDDGPESVLQLRQVYISGFGVGQVWEQSRRILNAACQEIGRDLENLTQVGEKKQQPPVQINGDFAEESEQSEGQYQSDQEEENELDFKGAEEFPDDQMALGGDDLEDQEDIEAFDEDSASDASDLDQAPKTYVRDPNNLNDGFFSIDDFNKQSQFLEQHDARGDEDNPSDEDEVDWDADPLAIPLKSVEHEHDEDDSDGEGGPTFGNADLDGSDSDEEGGAMVEDCDSEDSMAGLSNTNDIKYADFFEPPPKKPSKTKRMRALPKTQPPKATQTDPEQIETDIQRAISDVRRDLFDSEDDPSASGSDSEQDSDTNTPYKTSNKNLSTHEKQRAKIAAEIRRLEAASVAKRDWTLSGEARAAERPLNSLIEESLEFERTGKPVPVITAEISEEIETLIKRRVIARDFDEIIRRRPDAAVASETRRGRIELDDTKPSQSLAETYESEHLANTDPAYVDRRSAATKKQHDEITRLWKEVSGQLDVLSNLHFKPKRAEAEITTVLDKPVISMEDARPVGMGGEESRLAPQEIYRPGEDGKVNGEVVRRGGANVSKEELTREEKLRKRRREKERSKKATGNKAVEMQKDGTGKKKSRRAEQEDILTQLKKGGVKVVGKKGEMQELGGKKRDGHAAGGVESASALKL